LASVWSQAPGRFGPEWSSECVSSLETVYGEVTHPLPVGLLDVMDGYAEFATDAMRNQVYYENTGRYQASSYEEVARNCYHNEEHMTLRYLPGMFLSHYVWPQHYHMQKGFRSTL